MSNRVHNRQAAVKTLSLGIRPIACETTALPTLPLEITHVGPFANNKTTSVNKIMLPTMEGISFEKIKNILFLEASGNYTVLHFVDGRQTLVCRSLCDIENRLPASAFVRIHRSHTIHLAHLKKYVRGKGGHVVLNNGAILAVSSGQKDYFLEQLERYFA
jgi:two-component system LytT family response regulator